jgi:hypothetical protein
MALNWGHVLGSIRVVVHRCNNLGKIKINKVISVYGMILVMGIVVMWHASSGGTNLCQG